MAQLSHEKLGELRSKYLRFFEDALYSNTRQSTAFGKTDEICAALCKLRNLDVLKPPRHLRPCCTFASMAYKYNSFETKVKIAHFTCLTLDLDDLMSEATMDASDQKQQFVEDARLFSLRLCNPVGYDQLYPTRGPLHPCLEELVRYCNSDLNPFFPNQPRMHMNLLCAILGGIEGNLLENEYVKSGFKYTPEAPRFPTWMRGKASQFEYFVMCLLGAPELVPGEYSSETSSSDYTFFHTKIYPMIPDLFVATNHLNDIMSFYKEFDEEDEAANFITSTAQAKQSTALEVFDEIVDEVVLIRKNLIVMAERSGSVKVKIAVEHYFQGFIAWHLCFRGRYRLTKVLGEDWHKGEYF